MHVIFLCLESNKYFFTIIIAFVLGLTSQLEIIIVLSFTLPDRHLTSTRKCTFYCFTQGRGGPGSTVARHGAAQHDSKSGSGEGLAFHCM
jgi:hypothetical protein